MYDYKGQLDEAINEYNKAIEINPRLAIAYINRGRTYVQGKGQYDQAISDCSKALEIDPIYALAYSNRAIGYYFKKEYDKAWDDVNKAQALGFQVPQGFIEELRKASGRQK